MTSQIKHCGRDEGLTTGRMGGYLLLSLLHLLSFIRTASEETALALFR